MIKLVFASATLAVAAFLGAPALKEDRDLKNFLGRVLEQSRLDRIVVASVPSRHGRVELAYIDDQNFCGTAGCTLVITRRTPKSAFALLGQTPGIRPPITFEGYSINGYPNVGVRVRGGAATKPYRVVLRFDGSSYPAGTSKLSRFNARAGRVLIAR